MIHKELEFRKIYPDYRHPIYIPCCPVHDVRMYSNKTIADSMRFVCQFKPCKIVINVEVLKYVPEERTVRNS